MGAGNRCSDRSAPRLAGRAPAQRHGHRVHGRWNGDDPADCATVPAVVPATLCTKDGSSKRTGPGAVPCTGQGDVSTRVPIVSASGGRGSSGSC